MAEINPRKFIEFSKATTTKYQHTAKKLIDGDPTGLLKEFKSIADKGAVTTNVDSSKLLCFHDESNLIDGRKIAIARAGGDTAVGLTNFESSQGEWYTRREAFETLWESGHRIVYFALNCGGMGTEGKYGPICIVIPMEAAKKHETAVFPGDSVQCYTNNHGTVDMPLLISEIGELESHSNMVITKNGNEAISTSDSLWRELICNRYSYLEVDIVSPIPLSSIGEIRMRAAYLEFVDSLIDREIAGEHLTADERNQAHAISTARGWTATVIAIP